MEKSGLGMLAIACVIVGELNGMRRFKYVDGQLQEQKVGVSESARNPLAGQDEFIAAVLERNIPRLIKVLNHPTIDVNAHYSGYNALSYAVQHLDQKMVEVLLAHPDLELNIRGFDGNTVLHWLVLHAWLYGDDRCFRIYELLSREAGARFDVSNDEDLIVDDLLWVLYRSHYVNIRYARPFADFGSYTVKIQEPFGDCAQIIEPLGDLEVKVQRSLSKFRLREDGVRNYTTSYDEFMAAVLGHNVAKVERLLNFSAIDVNALYFGRTALEYAVIHLDLKMIEVLLAHEKLDPNIQGLGGNTVLHWLILWARDHRDPLLDDIYHLLLNDPRTRFDLPNNEGYTADDLLNIKVTLQEAQQLLLQSPLQTLDLGQ